MSARRYADVQALAAVGVRVSKKFLGLELQQLKSYAATSSLLKSKNRGSSTTPSSSESPASTASTAGHGETTSTSTTTTGTAPSSFVRATSTSWIDQLFTSTPSLISSPVQPTLFNGQKYQASEAQLEPSLLDPSFLATPAAHGYHRPTVSTITPETPVKSAMSPLSSASTHQIQQKSLKKETPINTDALQTLRRESKWLDAMRPEDTTGLNLADPSFSAWQQKERLGPRMMVYESLQHTEEQSNEQEHIADQQPFEADLFTSEVSGSAASTPSPLTQASTSPSQEAQTVPEPETTTSRPFHKDVREVVAPQVEASKSNLTEAAMPTSRVSRLLHYGGLAASLGMGAISETVRRSVGRGTASSESPSFLTPANMDRLVNKLTKMRGAALKLGQMLSIQDNKMLPPELEEVLLRVQNSANFMPEKQMRSVMSQTMGSNWESEFSEFNMTPIAAASIGQVHRAVHRATGMEVAVKVQYPGVAASIDSDLSNLKTLVVMSSLLPRGMYLDNTIKVAQRELGWETDYLREAECIAEFGRLLKNDRDFQVPRLVPEACGPMVLTMEWMSGETMQHAMTMRDQEARDRIGTNIMALCLRELFEFQYMQTDPNWSNFLYNDKTNKLELLDFGATRGFDKRFTTLYLHTLQAGASGDRDACLRYSRELGFLTGEETPVMETAHINSLLTLAEPFHPSAPDMYDFRYQTITQRVKDQIPTMLKHRLTPPPDETYSMHRKLAGAFLLCSKLGARVECKKMFREITARYSEDRVDDRRGMDYGRGR